MTIPHSIFRAYDIRGVVTDALTADNVRIIGQSIGSEALERGSNRIVVGRDGRLSGPELQGALMDGLRAAGMDVVDIGAAPTPVIYYAMYEYGIDSSVAVTGSHNPPNYNGLKMTLAGAPLSGEDIQQLYQRIQTGNFREGAGSLESRQILDAYVARVTSDVKLARPLKLVIDCGNGIAGAIAPQLFKKLGAEVSEIFCEVDGTFPNHHPDPSKPENLVDLIRMVQETNADVGFAFDGDGDRLGVVDRDGKVLWADRQMILFAEDVLSRNPGAEIIFDVKSSKNLATAIADFGGTPTMWKTGHSFIKKKLKESGAALGGEMSGHIFFVERWYGFDDGLYAGARMLEILSKRDQLPTEVFAGLPDSLNTPEINISFSDDETKFAFMEQMQQTATFPDANVITIDGLRVEYADGWGLIRPSNTTPVLVLRFEADSSEALERIKSVFREQMLALDAGLDLEF
jgi:phosphomannomutase / phosphoglucomutase